MGSSLKQWAQCCIVIKLLGFVSKYNFIFHGKFIVRICYRKIMHAKGLLEQYNAAPRTDNDIIKRKSNITFPNEGKHSDENDSLRKTM